MGLLLGIAAASAGACSERTPTSVDPDLVDGRPASVEVVLPWEEFGSNLQVFGGYGSVNDLAVGLVARRFGGELDARTVVRFQTIPTAATVTDSTGTSRTDTLLTVTGGRVVAIVDTLRSIASGPVTLELGVVRQPWHAPSAGWHLAVDTGGVRTPWEEPGGGPVRRVATTVWDRARGDSAVFVLDSTQLAIWRDTSVANQGALVGAVSEGARLQINSLVLRALVRPSLRRDTTLVLNGAATALTFLYTPNPGPPAAGTLRVGGVPAWRSVLDIAVPARLTGPASLCAAVGCPLELSPTQVSYAAIVLTTMRADAAFRPADSLSVDVRAVLQRSAMPKSPLGPSLGSGAGRSLAAPLFWESAGQKVEIPITNFVRTLVQGDSVAGFAPPRSLALLSLFEPSSFPYAAFAGPGMPGAPALKLVVTAGRAIQLP